MQPESLIFDIDGTLWDSRALVAEGYNLQLEAEGLSRYRTNAERLKSLFGRVMTDIADALFADIPAPERYALMERCMARENRHLRESACDIGYPHVRETIAELSQRHRLFIVSNSQCGYPEVCMGKLGITEYFTGWLCFGDTGACKGETIRRLTEKYGISSACYIGDTRGDEASAQYAGIPFVYCAYGFGTAESPWKTIGSFAELAALF